MISGLMSQKTSTPAVMGSEPALTAHRRLLVLGRQLCQPCVAPPAASPALAAGTAAPAQHSAAVIGLGWMGLLYDLAQRITEVTQEMIDRGDFCQDELGRRFEQDDATRPTPTLLTHRRFQLHEHPGDSGLPSSYSEALHRRAEIDLVAAADRDTNRLAAFSERYGPEGYGGPVPHTYTDAGEMLAAEHPEIVAIATNTKGRATLTALAVEHGAKMILTDKPMAFSLEEADLMVRVCAEAGVPLCCGSISTTHPSFERAKQLLTDGAIGDLISIEAPSPGAQHQDWGYFLDSPVVFVMGHGDGLRAESGSTEFQGSGMLVAEDGTTVHFRKGAPQVRLSGSTGEMVFDLSSHPSGWRLFQEVPSLGSRSDYLDARNSAEGGMGAVLPNVVRTEMPWPGE